jgi:carbon-monoxide dehydrogenase medium subunit
MKPVAFDWQRATDLPQALRARADGALCVAGGQSLGPMLNLRLVQPQILLEIRQLAAMRATHVLQGRLRIGAAVTHAEIEDGVLPDTTQGMLRYVARNIAYRAIRNRGTLGGSLAHCDPAADWVNALTALGAQVILQNAKQERRLPMPEFVRGPFHTALQPDEMLLAVELPAFTSALRWGYYKICAKVGEFADAIGVVVSDPGLGWHCVLSGAIEARPLLVQGVTDLLQQPLPAAEVVRLRLGQALQEQLPNAEAVFVHRHVVALQRALMQCLAQPGATADQAVEKRLEGP